MGNCAGILLKYKNQCLLCKRAQGGSLPGVWSVPGGHLEKGESIENGAIREFVEEIFNIKISDIKLNEIVKGVKDNNLLLDKYIYKPNRFITFFANFKFQYSL